MATPDDNSVTDPPFDPSSNLDEAVRGLLQGGSWIFTGPRLLTYSLHSDTLLASWSDAQTVAVDRAFAAWAAVANIQFKRVAGPTDYTLTAADLAITISADLASVYPGATAVGVFPDPAYANTLLLGLGMGRFSYPHPEGDIFLNVFATELNYFSPGGAGFAVGLHEIGHALGLKHPFDDGGNLRPTFAELGIGALDNGLDTVMSYNDAFPSSPSYANSYQITPMALDILAIQRIYGANMSYHTGNDTYRLLNDSMVRAVWDAGGIDTFDASALKSAVTIELTPGFMIDHGLYSRTAIAYGVTIENAIGGTGNDSLTGNAADNRLDGRAGADVMTGGLGNDTYVLDNAGDVVTENLNEGTDTVQASISYTLGPNLENLTLTGTAAINGTGNGLDNVITGNAAANVLDGGAGADTLIGGAGADTYVVDNPGDTVSELSTVAGVIDTVLASVGFTLGANLENLTLTGSGNIDGTGNGLANVLSGNAGINVLAGGAGNDTYIVNTAGDTVVETSAVATEIDLVQSSVSFTLGDNLEKLTLADLADIDGSGNGLANTIQGNDGANVLDGGAGADTLKGGKGDDTYRVDLVKSGTVAVLQDVVTENLNEGTDDTLTLRTAGALGLAAATTLTLGANLENLDASATGSTKLNLTGNAGNNILTGNDWDNILNGGLGNDTLIGGAGNDTYLLDNAGDQITELDGEGIDLVQVGIATANQTYTLGEHIENGTLINAVAFNLTGNALDNILTGNALANTLSGGAGNDILNGGAGADSLIGGIGNDTYVVDNVLDKITEDADEGTDSVQSSVTYTLTANLEHLTLTGAAAINGTGNDLDNILTGNAAANILDGGDGADTLIGGLGGDTYIVDDGGDVITETSALVSEIDTVKSSLTRTLGANLENLTLTGPADIDGSGNAHKNLIAGNSGANILDGGLGADTLIGGLGNDTYVVDNVLDLITESSALVTEIDSVQSSVSWTLGANLENLTLTGSSHIAGTGNVLANSLTGNGGNNLLDGKAGIDNYAGGVGDDTYVLDLEAELGTITEQAGEGSDTLRITYANALVTAKQVDLTQAGLQQIENVTVIGSGLFNLTGNALDNILTGNALANTLSGGAGNDILNGGAGADSLIGGIGNDIYVVDVAGDSVTEIDGQGTDTVVAAFNISLLDAMWKHIENATLSGKAANVTGDEGANVLTGNAAANILDGGDGADTLIGGLGGDTYIVNTAGDTVVETSAVATEIDLVQSSVSFTLGHNLENLTLTDLADIDGSGNGLANTIQGNDGANVLDGGAGADTLKGGKGDDTYRVDLKTVGAGAVAMAALEDTLTENLNQGTDTLVLRGTATPVNATTLTLGANLENLDASATGSTKLNLTGNAGNNILTGNDWDNILNGGLGNDTLIGGAGNDSFTGGAGNDTFVIERVASMVAAISDFEAGIDKLGLGQTAYSALFTGGALKAGVFDNGAAATTVTQWLFYNAGSGGLFYDSDGTGVVAAVQVATLSHKPALTASDFVLVAGS